MVRKSNKMEEKRQNGRQAVASAGTLEHHWPDDLFAEEPNHADAGVTSANDIEQESLAADEEEPTSIGAKSSSRSSDDALGLYLKQMGAIPLLNRKQELELAERLETARSRFRHADLSNWYVLGREAENFVRIKEGKLALVRTLDGSNSVGLCRARISVGIQ